ncbi:MAG: VanZ family protein [Candidatus Binataceae bacterium]
MRRKAAESAASLESRIVTLLLTIAFVAALAAFSITFLTHSNKFAVVEPIIRRLAPDASAAEVSRLHIVVRKIGHFLIPAVAYFVLVIGPLRSRRYGALALCAIFAVLDETLQAFTPARTASIYDVALDMSGVLFSFFVFSAFTMGRCRAVAKNIARN